MENTKRKILKANKAITLIALVVTIIVLLILAGVSIITLMGDNGIITRTQQSKQLSEEAAAKEKVKLAVQAARIHDKSYSYLKASDVRTAVNNEEGLSTDEEGEFPVVVTAGIYKFTIYKEGDIELGEPKKMVANATIDEVYGKPIDYDVDLGKNTEGNDLDLDGNPQYDWQIFYYDGTNIYIIAEDYVPLYYQTTYIKNPMIPTGIGNFDTSAKPYSLYWNYNDNGIQNEKTGATDIFGSGATDRTQYIANLYLSKWKAQTTSSQFSNAKMVASLMDTRLWTSFASSTKVNELTEHASELVAIGSPTVEMWVNSWNQKHGTTSSDANKAQLHLVATYTGYKIGTMENPTGYSVNNNGATGYQDKLYYPRKDDYKNASEYWLSSPSAEDGNRIMHVRCYGQVEASNYYSSSSAIRPVVCLPSDITAEWNDENNIWNIVKR